MSYIINNTNPFISTKLTEKGRELLAKGQLTFGSWAIGDSEINYDREAIVDANPSDAVLSKVSRVLRPKDRQPNIKYYINTGTDNPFTAVNGSNLRTMKIVVNNNATPRGFFSGDSANGYVTRATTEYIKLSNVITSAVINGGNTLNIGVAGAQIGDLLLLKAGIPNFTNTKPVPHLWYKIQGVAGTTVTVDRTLPDLNITDNSMVIVYSGGEVYNGFGSGSTTAYWDTGTLSFDASCDITREDVPVWNQNNVFVETLAGITGTTYENNTRFGSYDYLGQMVEYLEFGDDNEELLGDVTNSCGNISGLGAVDSYHKSIGILHYTNNTISNLYGEFFYIDNTVGKTVKIHMPDLMYHRRAFSGSSTGNKMGMSFIASGDTQLVGSSQIEYVDLIEDPAFIGLRTPKAVGKVYPQLKMIVIEDGEILAAMSYKANRNWTLPELSISLANPVGNSAGVLPNGSTMYVTYGLESTSGLTTPLLCQTYTRVTNILPTSKDVEFKIAETDLLTYMKKVENVGYDNSGFYAHRFKVMYQIVADSERPDPSLWKVYDFTSTTITGVGGQTINPLLLENQNPASNNQVINIAVNSAATQFDITQSLSLAPVSAPNNLQFGDERFFYGNVEAYIGATIYKTMFDIRIDGGQFNRTTNPTRSTDNATNPPAIKVSEVGIYDNNNELVIIGKLSKPIKLESGKTIMVELSLDF